MTMKKKELVSCFLTLSILPAPIEVDTSEFTPFEIPIMKDVINEIKTVVEPTDPNGSEVGENLPTTTKSDRLKRI